MPISPSKTLSPVSRRVAELVENPSEWVFQGTGVELRPYQTEPLPWILDSIENHWGLTFLVIFPRQSGKDELLTHFIAYLLDLFAPVPAGIVVVNPTHKPQTATAMLRFDQALSTNLLTRNRWEKRAGFMRTIGLAKAAFLSGAGQAAVVGATASLLLVVNEAQDILPKVFDLKFDPMTASTNATKVFCGTVWTENTLLARELKNAQIAEKEDGYRRAFVYDADTVGQIVPWYKAHVQAKVKVLGRQHPMIKTQYFNETIDAQGGMFPARRLALMQGDQPGQESPIPGHIYAFVIDVGGSDEAALELDGTGNPGRDSETLRIMDVDLSSLQTLGLPTYRAVHYRKWTGENHVNVFGQQKALADIWRPLYIVIDATGVGEGQYSLWRKAFPSDRVIPVKFSAQKKSELGYAYIAVIETGRMRDCCQSPQGSGTAGQTEEIRIQYEQTQTEILPGPQKLMRWGVPDGTRVDGELIHDDVPLADCLVCELDALEWHIGGETIIIQAEDPITAMSRDF